MLNVFTILKCPNESVQELIDFNSVKTLFGFSMNFGDLRALFFLILYNKSFKLTNNFCFSVTPSQMWAWLDKIFQLNRGYYSIYFLQFHYEISLNAEFVNRAIKYISNLFHTFGYISSDQLGADSCIVSLFTMINALKQKYSRNVYVL